MGQNKVFIYLFFLITYVHNYSDKLSKVVNPFIGRYLSIVLSSLLLKIKTVLIRNGYLILPNFFVYFSFSIFPKLFLYFPHILHQPIFCIYNSKFLTCYIIDIFFGRLLIDHFPHLFMFYDLV